MEQIIETCVSEDLLLVYPCSLLCYVLKLLVKRYLINYSDWILFSVIGG